MTDEGATAVFRRQPLQPGLYLVATPIGNARDITLRALDILASADVIAAEDTRRARQLMALHAVPVSGRPVIAYHDHNGHRERPRLLARIADGQSVAFVSDAGTPLVADPGYRLAKDATEAGLSVTSAPGPSAALAALSLAGLPSDRFLFAGFAPSAAGARKKWLGDIAHIEATVILFETSKRIHGLLDALCEVAGEDRQAALCRELTKRFEEARRGPLGALRDGVQEHPPKGEIVLVLAPATAVAASVEDMDVALRDALARLPVRDAASEVAQALGLKRRDVYQAALALRAEGGRDENSSEQTDG